MKIRDHSPQAIAARMAKGPRQSYLRDFVYGGIDGAVTTFAVVSGVVGANLSLRTILILGFANLIADGFSMAAGNYLGTRAEDEERRHHEAVEREEIRTVPEGEVEEVRQILASKGLSNDTLEKAVKEITADQNKWVQLMIAEEYGLPAAGRSALRAAATTFAAFIICGLVPLTPYLLPLNDQFTAACIATAVAFFGIGSLKSLWTIVPWWKSGLGTLAVGGISATIAYAIGVFLKGLA